MIKSLTIPLLREVIYDTYDNFPTTGLSVGDLAWATDRKCLYRWSGSAWESIGISSRHGNYEDIGDPADYPESSLYQADDQDTLYMVVEGAWESVANPPQFSGQHVVTGSRALNTAYQNQQGQAIMVLVTGECNYTDDFISAFCDENSDPTTKVAEQTAGDPDSNAAITFIVPDGYYYKVTGSDTILTSWIEYY